MKQIIVLVLFIFHASAFSQKPIPTDGPCTNAIIEKAKGRWMKHPGYDMSTNAEANKRMDEIHNLFLNIYPQAIGVDALWHRRDGISYFGAKRKYSRNGAGALTFDYSNLPHFAKYYYRCGFFAYHCSDGNSMLPGYPGETGSTLTITANETQGSVSAGGAPEDTWTINGLPVGMRAPVLKTIRGFEMQYPEPGSSARYILVHRKGALPYTPVTRKQYLNYCIIYYTKLHDETIKGIESMPVRTMEEQEQEKKTKLAKFEKDFGSDPKRLKSAVDHYLSSYQTDQQQRDERANKAKKNKEDELKKFTDELEKTTIEGLLDSPAFVLVKYFSSPIFETDPLKGHMLITENPDYIRKDLPKHVPQVFVVWWRFNNWPPQKKIGEIIEEEFPFEKLQAMIDK